MQNQLNVKYFPHSARHYIEYRVLPPGMLTEHVLGSCPEVFMFHNTECIPELELCPEVFMFLNTEFLY